MINNRYKPTGSAISGGMGDIIECLDQNLQRRVVVKLLQDGQDERRLIDEQKALLKVRSKHVVQLFDVIQFDRDGSKVTGLVLEFIDGHTLTPGMCNADETFLHLLWQISSGLADIHGSDIIH